MAICGKPSKYGGCGHYVHKLVVLENGQHVFACYYHAPMIHDKNSGSFVYSLEVLSPPEKLCDECAFYDKILYCAALRLAWCESHLHPLNIERVSEFMQSAQARVQRRRDAIQAGRMRREVEEIAKKAQEKLF